MQVSATAANRPGTPSERTVQRGREHAANGFGEAERRRHRDQQKHDVGETLKKFGTPSSVRRLRTGDIRAVAPGRQGQGPRPYPPMQNREPDAAVLALLSLRVTVRGDVTFSAGATHVRMHAGAAFKANDDAICERSP